MRRDRAIAAAFVGGVAAVVLLTRPRYKVWRKVIRVDEYPLPETDAIAFYADVLRGLNLSPTYDRMRYLTAWRLAEGGRATWNPFNTTWAGGSAGNFNAVGVKHYPTREAGLHATIATLRLRYYTDLRARLERDDPAEVVAESPNLRTWGTGHGVARVLAAHAGALPYRAPLYAMGRA